MRKLKLDLDRVFRRNVGEALEEFFDKLRGLHDRPGHGGYFTIADGRTGYAFLSEGIGEVEEEKSPRFQLNSAEEKPRRLAQHPEHMSSWQSADLDLPSDQRKKFAGAVRCGDYIFSFSGLPEMLDEAVVLVVAVMSGELHKDAAMAMAKMSSNEFYAKVLAIATTSRDYQQREGI